MFVSETGFVPQLSCCFFQFDAFLCTPDTNAYVLCRFFGGGFGGEEEEDKKEPEKGKEKENTQTHSFIHSFIHSTMNL